VAERRSDVDETFSELLPGCGKRAAGMLSCPALRDSGAESFRFPPRPLGKATEGGETYVEKTETGKLEGLSLRELEAHARAELLPDRIEMHRRVSIRKRIRRRKGNVSCGDMAACNRLTVR
jgi:hypothetical protein